MRRTLLTIIITSLLFVALGWYILTEVRSFYYAPPKKETTHEMVVEKIEGMGKLELVKYTFKDVVTHKEVYEWFPDPKVLLIIAGEAVGCLDLSQIDSSQVVFMGDSIVVNLPEPEFCYVKVDHQNSQVYETQYTYWNEAEMIDEAYKLAEIEIQKAAEQSQVLDQTRQQARLVLRPMLESLTGKKVILLFPVPKLKVE
ncbi:MAG: DUF4230 domain-containing protein [Bacteroidota bacterium]